MYLKRGLLTRSSCVACGSSSSQMHHEDYSRPLDVMWLCRECHLKRHDESRNLYGGEQEATVTSS